MYRVKLFSSVMRRGLSVANALKNPMLHIEISSLKDVNQNSKAHAYVVVLKKLNHLELLPKSIFNFPIILLYESNEAPNDKLKLFERVFRPPFNFYNMSVYLRYLIVAHQNTSPEAKLMASDLILNLDCRKARYRGGNLDLSNKEFSLLEFLMRHPGKAFTRNQILESVWDRNSNLFTNTVDVHVGKLRRKIDAKSPERFIKTIHGFGYVFEKS